MIAFLDPGAAYREMAPEIDSAMARVSSSGRYIGGEECDRFEEAFAGYVGAAHAVGTGNGLDALVIALRALGVGPGDEVIVPAHTFVATWLAVSAVGALPVPVEPDRATMNLDVHAIEQAIGSRTRAIVPVHLYGQPVDLDPILALARRHGVAVLEDAAQAHGARYKGRRVGSQGDLAAWSFYPAKNLGALGDGGCVSVSAAAAERDGELANRIRLLGNYGSREKYRHETLGANSRLDPLQAAVLAEKLRVLDRWNDRRRTLAQRYCDGLAAAPVELPTVPVWAECVWHLFVIRTPERDRLQQWLADDGIQTVIHYPVPPHLQPAYAHLELEKGALPIGPHLSADDVDRVCDRIARFG